MQVETTNSAVFITHSSNSNTTPPLPSSSAAQHSAQQSTTHNTAPTPSLAFHIRSADERLARREWFAERHRLRVGMSTSSSTAGVTASSDTSNIIDASIYHLIKMLYYGNIMLTLIIHIQLLWPLS